MVKDNFRIAYDPIGSHVYSQHDGISTRKFRLQAASLRAAIDCAHLGNHYCRRKRNVVIAQKCRCQILWPRYDRHLPSRANDPRLDRRRAILARA